MRPASRLCIGFAALLCLATLPSRAAAPAATELERIESRHAQLLVRHRPDLAARWNVRVRHPQGFAALSEATADAHVRTLRALLERAGALPAGARADTLRARLAHEIAETAPGGALRRDALLWLDMVAAAARAPFAEGPAGGCSRTHRATRQLRAVPEALRGAAVLLRGTPPPDGSSFEDRLASVETLLRRELPSRTELCKEPRRLAEFVEADTLAAAALGHFRRMLLPSP